jgi:hypothetical protein
MTTQTNPNPNADTNTAPTMTEDGELSGWKTREPEIIPPIR